MSTEQIRVIRVVIRLMYSRLVVGGGKRHEEAGR